jgi:hypothetical protein
MKSTASGSKWEIPGRRDLAFRQLFFVYMDWKDARTLRNASYT